MKKYSIIIAGSRTFTDYLLLKKFLDEFIVGIDALTIISGTAKGADSMGERYATENGIPILRCPADWKRYRRGAGAKRNEDMARLAIKNESHGVLFAFWDGVSGGTKQMITIAKQYGLEIHIIDFKN